MDVTDIFKERVTGLGFHIQRNLEGLIPGQGHHFYTKKFREYKYMSLTIDWEKTEVKFHAAALSPWVLEPIPKPVTIEFANPGSLEQFEDWLAKLELVCAAYEEQKR